MIIYMGRTIDYFYDEKIMTPESIQSLLDTGEIKEINSQKYLVIQWFIKINSKFLLITKFLKNE